MRCFLRSTWITFERTLWRETKHLIFVADMRDRGRLHFRAGSFGSLTPPQSSSVFFSTCLPHGSCSGSYCCGCVPLHHHKICYGFGWCTRETEKGSWWENFRVLLLNLETLNIWCYLSFAIFFLFSLRGFIKTSSTFPSLQHMLCFWFRILFLSFWFTSSVWTSFKPKCSLPRVCPPDHFAFRIRSGAANVVGPQICFEGKK